MGVHPYISCIDMCRHKGKVFFAPFWTENGTDFAQCGLESGMVFEGTTAAV